MVHFHSLQVKKVVRETEDCVSIQFAVPDDLKEVFRFTQGQNITLKKELNGQEMRRNYSICSSPADSVLRVAVKQVPGGVFSTWANTELTAGAWLDVLPPMGKFYTPLHPQQAKNYVAFAAGSGITPLLSIIKTTLQTEARSSFTLVYGNRGKATILFREELEALKDKYLNRFRVYHVLSREKSDVPVNVGRIDTQKLDLLFGKLIALKHTDDFFICGPNEMIFCVKDYLSAAGVDDSKIHFELFTAPGQTKAFAVSHLPLARDEGPKANISVKLDGITFDFDLAYSGESILDAALKQGADLPYACKGGVCTTCKARVLQGAVRMDVNWGLEPDELAAGFVLTCQAHPITEKVVVDFDAK